MTDLCEAQKIFMDALMNEVNTRGIEACSAEELGAVADMIKDMAEAAYYNSREKYYTSIVEAMARGAEEYRNDIPEDSWRYRMGYTETEMMPDRYGRAYHEWERAKRHYHESKKETDHDEMDRHARECLSDTVESMRDILKFADPELKKRMKADLTALIGEMTA